MTIQASSTRAAALFRFCMKTVFPRLLLISMAGGAGHFGRRILVGRRLHVRVTIDTGKHPTVQGIFEFLRVNMEAYWFAINIFGEAGIAMAGQTIIIRRFLSG